MPLTTDNQWARTFIGGSRNYMEKQSNQHLRESILKLVISGLTSLILTVLSTVNLQFQGQFVPISLRPVVGIVALTSWLHPAYHIVNFPHLVGVSISRGQLTRYDSVSSIVLELKVLGFV